MTSIECESMRGHVKLAMKICLHEQVSPRTKFSCFRTSILSSRKKLQSCLPKRIKTSKDVSLILLTLLPRKFIFLFPQNIEFAGREIFGNILRNISKQNKTVSLPKLNRITMLRVPFSDKYRSYRDFKRRSCIDRCRTPGGAIHFGSHKHSHENTGTASQSALDIE